MAALPLPGSYPHQGAQRQAGGSEEGRSSGPLQLNGGGGGREVGTPPVLGGLQLQLQQLNKQVTTGWRINVADGWLCTADR